jgi:hypothetical protein
MSTDLNVSPPAARRFQLRPLGRLRSAAPSLSSTYAKAIAAAFACLALMLVWNVAHYPAGVSPDAQDHFHYTNAIRYQHHLPGPEKRIDESTGQWYNPPLFYVSAAVIETATNSHKAVQLFNVLLALGVALLAFLTARELWPRSKVAQGAVVAAVALSPPFVRGAIEYHGQMLATFLSTAALYVVARALVRDKVTVKAGLWAGVLLALGMLTRQFVLGTVAALLAALGAYWLFTRRGDALRMAGVMVLSIAVLTAPWFIHQQVKYHNALINSVTKPNKPYFSRQPSSFYFGSPRKAVFTQPYRPTYDNRFPQVPYTDWWGDYFLHFDVPPNVRVAQGVHGGRLPAQYHNERVRQSYVGVLPTLVILAGLVGLIGYGIRRRAAHLLAIPLLAGAVAAEAIWVYIGYPTSDGDFMKATYLLTALPALALALGWVLMRLRERGGAAFAVVVAGLGVAAAVDIPFVVLHHMVGRGV